ncbi:MAG: hypothetical protein WKI04_00540 [Ferruginibacter sp.]
MILKLKSPVLLFILSIFFYSCEKEYSIEGNVVAGTAVFSFTGSPGTCTNAVVTGAYDAGVALGATNNVTIEIDVTTIGSYSITTATINGISFSGTGSFTVTGPQTVSLAGSGIPLVSGTFSFTPDPGGCVFPVVITNGGRTSTAAFTFTGAPGACTTATPAGTYQTGTALTASNTITIDVNVTTPGTWVITTPAVNGMTFSGSGNFTTATPQTVTLTGSGTPVTEGVFDFTLPNNGCSFPITVFTGTPATDFLKCTIDGVARTFNVDLIAIKASTTSFVLGGSETADANSPQFEIDLTNTPDITAGAYNKFSATNTTTYSIGLFDNGVAATPWSIGLVQTGPFLVTVTAITTTRIEGTFAGTLYDDNGLGAGAIEITDGSFSIPY